MNDLISLPPSLGTLLLLATPLLPVFTAALFIVPKWRSAALILAPFAGLPGLLMALLVIPGTTLDLPSVLLGTRLGIDATGQVFLLFTALLWLLAGFFSLSYMANYDNQPGFTAFYLLAMSGNFGLILAQELVSFYFFFALMSFASYGLVIHNRDAFSIYASKVYLVLVIVGELMVFTAFIMMSTQANTIYMAELSGWPINSLVVGLLLVGFGIKAGALPLHFWLPLAHPAAPVPASAVLSGAMIKAGLIGWLRFLPFGSLALPEWGVLVIGAGLAAAFYAALVGVSQSNPKTVLAYSSISQMGLITIGVGIGLIEPSLWSTVLPAILLYALHHGLAKGTLFLGVGILSAVPNQRAKFWSLIAMMLPALALAGAPLTSGALAKTALKAPIPSLPVPWPAWLDALLPLAAVGTTLLMARFIYLMRLEVPKKKSLPVNMWLSWVMLLFSVAFIAWTTPAAADFARYSMDLYTIWLALWPLGLGLLMAVMVGYLSIRRERLPYTPIPPGDLLVLLEWMVKQIQLPRVNIAVPKLDQLLVLLGFSDHSLRFSRILVKIERHLTNFTVIGVLVLFAALVLFFVSLTAQ